MKHRLWAVVDSCDEPEALQKCREAGDRSQSLYRGWAETEFAAIAPYLVHLDEKLLEWIYTTLWKKPWGILIYSSVPQKHLRTHLRRFLRARAPDKNVYLLRYYDPRILKAFLGACNPDELNRFFGPVRAYGISSGSDATFFRKAF